MEVRKTPHISDPIRRRYEEAFFEEDTSRMTSIELDTAIDNLLLSTLRGMTDVPEAISTLQNLSTLAIDRVTSDRRNSSFNSYDKALTIAEFSVERYLAPMLYSLDSDRLGKARRSIADGIEGKSSGFIEAYLDIMDSDRLRRDDPLRRQIRGGIQEHTICALLNSDQSGIRLTLPSSTSDDVTQGTDLNLYRYDTPARRGYRHSISVKSTEGQRATQQMLHPDLVIVTAEDIDNLGLATSRLIVKKNAGAPGLTELEEARLSAIKTRLLRNVLTQIEKREASLSHTDALDTIDDSGLALQLCAVA